MRQSALLLFLFFIPQLSFSACDPSCATCFGTTSATCLTCSGGNKLQNFYCVASCDTASGYQYDAYDNTCKKSRYQYEHPCSPGYYNGIIKKSDPTDCLDCPAGYFCPGLAYQGPPLACRQGYYCEANSYLEYNDDETNQVKTKICRIGTYCPSSSGSPKACPAGQYCDQDRLATPTNNCAEGYFCSGSAIKARPTTGPEGGHICTAGYYCGIGASEEVPCPAGYYLDRTGATSNADCMPCTPGWYCGNTGITAPTAKCDPGFYCPAGMSTPAPPSFYCPAGYKCPQGSADKIPCTIDQYQDMPMQSTCSPCPAGSYCESGSLLKPCKAGYYCAINNVVYACSIGQYLPTTGSSVIGDCLSCPQGYACETPGLANPVITCGPGYYCTGGTTTRYPSGTNGNICQKGYYCPDGSSAQKDCPEGYYCETTGLSSPTGKCQAGYYCPLNSQTSTAHICSAGHYCAAGSGSESNCPIGTYGPLTGASDITDCLACMMGQYCATPGLSAPSNGCSAGYYCPLSQTSGTPATTPCPKGYMCPANSVAPKKCLPGTYQPNAQQTTCLPCVAGYYCDGSDTTTLSDCPRGHYCLASTDVANKYPCLSSTYNEKLNMVDSTACKPCEPGYYCPLYGQISYSDSCADGYICISGAKIPNPTSGGSGTICPSGYYCPSGTTTSQACPAGTYYDGKEAIKIEDCQKVKPGYYSTQDHATTTSLNAGLGTTYDKCSAGYACFGGADNPTPTSISGQACAKDYYCPIGSSFQLYCDIGWYNNKATQATCTQCPAGFYCPSIGMDTPTSCIALSYCPLGSSWPQACPPGKYSQRTDATSASDCTDCPAGRYCEQPMTNTDSNKCADGFVCGGGSAYEKPPLVYDFNSGILNGRCPAGSMCTSGSGAPTLCSAGQLQKTVGAKECVNCPRGYFCKTAGITALVDAMKCDPGYYCISGAVTSQETTSGKGMVCPIGHFCEAGTSHEMRCPDGQIQTNPGYGTCDPCPAGSLCYYEKDSILPTGTVSTCELTHYCPGGAGRIGIICPLGTKGTNTGLKTQYACDPCDLSKYCVDGGQLSPDVCAAGYYCYQGATSPAPISEPFAYECSPGRYCEMGTIQETPCPKQKFRKDKRGRNSDECSDCQPGQYCIASDPVPQDCTKGHYCPIRTTDPLSCPIGTYLDEIGKAQIYECKSCPAGYYCKSIGIPDYTLYKCPASNYCLERCVNPIACLAGFYLSGSGSKQSDCQGCTAGYFCPSGTPSQNPCEVGYECPAYSPAEVKCEKGYYCNITDLSPSMPVKLECPAGFYCPTGTINPIVCPDEYICPKRAYRPLKCPYGSFRNNSVNATGGVEIMDFCYYCPRGYYAADIDCQPCPAGYICLGKTKTKYPLDPILDYGYECPAGYYCLEKSMEPTPCPIMTYRAKKIGKNISDCLFCQENSYNDLIGQASCTKCGASAYSTIPANVTNETYIAASPEVRTKIVEAAQCKCKGSNRKYFKSDSSCRCISGFYQSKYGIESKTDDSSADCEPHVYSTCASGEIYSHEGKCVKANDCGSQCGTVGGAYSQVYGICVCNQAKTLSDICNETCLSKTIKSKPTQTGLFLWQYNASAVNCTIPWTNLSETFTATGINFTLGYNPNVIQSLSLGSSGFSGTYNPTPNILKKAGNFCKSLLGTSARRLLQTNLSSSDYSYSISSPVLCVQPNSIVAFDVSPSHYPVYLKDSLMNTVKDFDYGAFIALAERLLKTTLETQIFMFNFTRNGTFLFGDSADNMKQMLVKVSISCNSSRYLIPATADELNKLDVAPRDDVITRNPLWTFMISVLIILLVFGIVIVVFRVWFERFVSWIYGKDVVTVMDQKKIGEPDEDEFEEMERLAKKGEDNMDGLFFIYLRQKLNEMDDKMRGLLEKANITSLKKLQKLAAKVNKLKEIFNEHVGALKLPNGNTIEEEIKLQEDRINKEGSDYSSIFEDSEDEKERQTPKKKKEEEKKELAPIASQQLSGDQMPPPAESPREQESKQQDMLGVDMMRESKKMELEEKKKKEAVDQELQKRREEYLAMIQKQGNSGNAEIQEFVKDEVSRLSELQKKLGEELENQKAALANKLAKKQEKKMLAKMEMDKLSKEQQEADNRYKGECEQVAVERKAELDEVEKEAEMEIEKGKGLIDEKIKKQLAEQHARFIQQFAESSDQDQLLARHEGETQRLKEHLESEQRRQEKELLAKIEQRTSEKKREILTNYQKRENVIKEKHEKLMEEMKAQAVVIQGSVPAEEEKYEGYLNKLEEDRNRVEKQLQKESVSETMLLEAKKRADLDAIEKAYELEEHDIKAENDRKIDEVSREQQAEERKLKEKFTKELKNAPTSKERNEILSQYELEKNALKDRLVEERKHVEEQLDEKLAERKRLREKKKVEAEAKLEQEKMESQRKAQDQALENIDKQSEDSIEQLVAQAIGVNQTPVIDVPVVFEYLIRNKQEQNLSELKKLQFAELSNYLANMHAQLMKEKFIEIAAIKETTAQKVKELESKGYPADKFKQKWEAIHKQETLNIEALNGGYENKALTQESHIRCSMANKHHDELIKLVQKEEDSRKRLFDKILRRYNTSGQIPKKVIEDLNAKKFQEYSELRDEIKNEKDRKISEGTKILGDLNQEDMKELERKYAEEINAQSKALDEKLNEKKKKAIEERRQQYETRLKEIPEMSVEQRKLLMSELQQSLEKIDKAMAEAREEQQRRLKEKLIQKNIQKSRITARVEKKTKEKIAGAQSEEAVIILAGQKEESSAPVAKPKPERKAPGYAYKPLLVQWEQKVKEYRDEAHKGSQDISQPNITQGGEEEEKKKAETFDETEGAYVSMKELFETILNCYDLAISVEDFEFPEIAKSIEKLTYFMDAIMKGGKKLSEASVSKMGAKKVSEAIDDV